MILLFISLLTIQTITPPVGYTRVQTDGFGTYLRKLALKQDNTVYLYNGKKKLNQDAQYAVLDVPVGNKDLQQCADAVMRLRADYLFSIKKYDQIGFKAVDGAFYKYRHEGYEPHYWKFMDFIYQTCNSHSLEQQMKPKNIKDIKIGDVLIRGGFPGHVVIVVDVAVNKQGKKAFMLAQSYMPAQDIHILKGEEGPWYFVKKGDYIIDTPEYTFRSTEVREW